MVSTNLQQTQQPVVVEAIVDEEEIEAAGAVVVAAMVVTATTITETIQVPRPSKALTIRSNCVRSARSLIMKH